MGQTPKRPTPGTAEAEMGFRRAIVHYLKPYWKHAVIVLVALLLQAAYRVLVPIGYQMIFDDAIANKDLNLLYTILIALAMGWLIHGVAGIVQDYLSAWIGSRMMNDLREQMFQQLQRLSAFFYARVDSGDLMSRFSNDLAVMENAFIKGLYTAVFSFIIFITSLIMLFTVEWRLASLTLITLAVSLMVPKVLGSRAQKSAYDRKTYEARVSATIQENIGAQSMLRVFGLSEYKLGQFRDQLTTLAEKTVAAFFNASLVGRAASQSVMMVQVIIMGTGGYLALNGHLSVGALVGFVALLLNVANAANHIAAVVPELLQASGGMRRVLEFLAEEPSSHDQPDAKPVPRLSSELSFKEVSFSYDEEHKMLDRLSFNVKAGESVAVVGSSGSGKSTILNMILRFYDPDEGAVKFDGVDLREGTEESLRKQIGVVPQETTLLNTSFGENIRMGKLDAAEAQIMEAAKMAEIHDMILNQADGYDTPVGERGGNLSGGQRQRIAIARAILRDPAVLVLDEATSALDPATETAVNATLEKVAQGRTVISATHRLGSISKVNRILVVDKGRIVEEGTHDELLETQGVYHQLWQKQSGFKISEDGYSAEITPDRLRNIPLLSGMDERGLASIADHLLSEYYPSERFVFMRGDPGEKFYIIVKGKIEILININGKDKRVATLEDGDFFGELALLDSKPRNATIRTILPSLFLTLERRMFRDMMEEEPSIREAIEKEARKRRD